MSHFGLSTLATIGGVLLATGVLLGATFFAALPAVEDSDLESDLDVDVDLHPLNSVPGEVRMALVVRTDLGMSAGKAAAQCAHAAVGCYRKMTDPGVGQNVALMNRWLRAGQAKVALKCALEEEMRALQLKAVELGIGNTVIRDAGRTEIEAGSATVLGLGPAPKSVLDQVTGKLRLY